MFGKDAPRPREIENLAIRVLHPGKQEIPRDNKPREREYVESPELSDALDENKELKPFRQMVSERCKDLLEKDHSVPESKELEKVAASPMLKFVCKPLSEEPDDRPDRSKPQREIEREGCISPAEERVPPPEQNADEGPRCQEFIAYLHEDKRRCTNKRGGTGGSPRVD
jgi:hypothetical protein